MNIWRRLFGKAVPKASADKSALPAPHRPKGFRDSEELAAFITAELAQSVPEGWRVERLRSPLAWAIKKECPGPQEWFLQEYDVWITKDLELLVITYDNRDIGPGPLYEHAVVLHVERSRLEFALDRAVREVMARFPPNEWGYT